MKQVLSVVDFATILNIVDRNIEMYETVNISPFCTDEQEKIKELKKHKEYLEKNQEYHNLKHLKESLQNLNIEIECPDVEIKGE